MALGHKIDHGKNTLSKKERVINSKLGMAIKSMLIYNLQDPPHLKSEWMVKVDFKWVWDGYGKNG